MSKTLGPRGFRVECRHAVYWMVAQSAGAARWGVYSRAREAGFMEGIGAFHVQRCSAIDGMKTPDPVAVPVVVYSAEMIGDEIVNPPTWEISA